uniref:Uncharacterized protein n=2 Tax=Graphocephala atropunctata TaxID=36148 RepID=A0A1B6KCA2_9HEMI
MLKKEREKTVNVTKELNETKASLFNATNELHHVTTVASEGQGLRESVTRLQRELVVGGEVQERYRQRVNSLLRHLQHSTEVEITQNSFSSQVSALNQELQNQNNALSAAMLRLNELDAQLAKRDATSAESKCLLEEAKNEFHDQLAVAESNYNNLKMANTKLEGELVELRYQLQCLQPQVPVEGVARSPPSLPLAPPEPFSNLHALVNIDAPDPNP